MTILSREQQEDVVLTFEKDYGKLLMENNAAKGDKSVFKNQAQILVFQIKQAARPSYFEEDVIEILHGISRSIQNAAS